MRELAIKTKISTTVLESIENGWIERLPESAYLSAMIPLLESKLGLSPGSLEAAINSRGVKSKPNRGKSKINYTPGNIGILTTWQGSIVYIILQIKYKDYVFNRL